MIKSIAIVVIALIIIGTLALMAYVSGYVEEMRRHKRVERPNPELEEARRLLYEITVHDDMIPVIPQPIRDRMDRHLGGPPKH